MLRELQESCAQLEDLIARINRTNGAALVEGVPLSDLLARRDCRKNQLRILRDFLGSASELVTRRTVGEIKIRSTVNVREMQKEVDRQSKALRELERRSRRPTGPRSFWNNRLIWLRKRRASNSQCGVIRHQLW